MTTWTKEELLAYTLIWCANADFTENEDEIEHILSKVSTETYNHIHEEFEADNDQQSIDKIIATLARLEYSEAEKAQIFDDMKEIFGADGEIDVLEHNLSRGLKHIFG